MPTPAKKTNLTDRFLKALKPADPGKRRVIWDSQVPSFGVRSTDKGHHSFVVGKRPAGSPQLVWTLLGSYPGMSLADARTAARAALLTLGEGKNPKAERVQAQKVAREEARRKKAGSFANVAEQYIKRHLPALRSGKVTEQVIRRELLPILGDRPVGEIKRRDIIELVTAISGSRKKLPGTNRTIHGGENAARRAWAALGGMFSWMQDHELVEHSPCSRAPRTVLGAPVARDRTLTDCELKHLWAAADSEGYPNGVLLKILMLTGQRLREIAEMRWSEIDLDQAELVIPAERMKGKQAHMVPLTSKVLGLLATVPKLNASDYIFTLTGSKPVNGFARLKMRLDGRLAERADGVIPGWVFHDIRRSVRTNLSRVGVASIVGELVIAHTQRGVQRTYNRYDYLDEKRAALEAWEKLLLSIVEPPAGDNVVPLSRKTG